jgi:amidase
VTVSAAGLDRWHDVFRTLQGAEAWAAHGAWIERARPNIGPFLVERLRLAARLGAAQVEAARAQRAALSQRLDRLLADGALLLLPSAPCPAPRIDASMAEHERIRAQVIGITSIASLGGLPQVSLPAARVPEGPVGLSLAAARGADGMLLDLVAGPLAALRAPAAA